MRALLIDDEPSLLNQAKEFLEKENDDLEIETVMSSKNALELIQKNQYDAIISDYKMQELDGIELLKILREEKESSIPFIMFTGRGQEKVAMEALNLGANHYVKKGKDPKSQYSYLAKVIEKEVKHRENAEMLVELNSLLASIRNINKLKFQEDEIRPLMKKATGVLHDQGGYLNIEIALKNEKTGKISPFAKTGEHEMLGWEITEQGQGDAPRCVKKVVDSGSTLVIDDKMEFCDECAYPHKNPEHKTILIPMKDEDETFGILIACQEPNRLVSRKEIELLEDITEDLSLARKRIKIRNSLEEERDLFVEGSTILFKWKNDEKWPVEYVTPNVKDILGYDPEELMNGEIDYADIISRKDIDQVRRERDYHKEREYKRINHQPYRLNKKNGENIWVKDHTKIVRDEKDDTVTYYLGYLVDITEQKTAERSLQKSEERYRRVFETAKSGIMLINAMTGEIKDVNPYVRNILDYSLDELQEKELWELESFENIAKNRREFKQLKDEGTVHHRDVCLKKKDEGKIEVDFVSNVYKAGGEKVIQFNLREI